MTVVRINLILIIGFFFLTVLYLTGFSVYFSSLIFSTPWGIPNCFYNGNAIAVNTSSTASRYKNSSRSGEFVFHPVNNKRLAKRLAHKCHIQLPTVEELSEYPFVNWPTSRFIAYYNIFKFLEKYINGYSTAVKDELRKLDVLDFGGSRFLKPFNKSFNVTLTKHPGVDIHQTSFPDEVFDIVSADQVMEHVTYPPIAMLELRRILKPGGMAILTSVSFNPLHESQTFNDIWRFMNKGFLVLSTPFDGGIKVCGTWGTKHFTITRADHGIGTRNERKVLKDKKADFVTSNDLSIPSIVWMVLEK